MDNRTPEQIRANPIVGDMIITKDYPPGTPMSEITEFEIWDGSSWVKSEGARDKVYLVQAK